MKGLNSLVIFINFVNKPYYMAVKFFHIREFGRDRFIAGGEVRGAEERFGQRSADEGGMNEEAHLVHKPFAQQENNRFFRGSPMAASFRMTSKD